MVTGVVRQDDEYLCQDVMSIEKLYQALHDVREMLTPILTRRRRRQQQEKE